MTEQNKVYTCTGSGSTRVRKDSWKKTVSITLPRELIERARKRSLNLSRVMEQALSSILDYLETQEPKASLDFLSPGSFIKKVEAGPPGIEPGTPGFLCGPFA